jgi:hypothetical protein
VNSGMLISVTFQVIPPSSVDISPMTPLPLTFETSATRHGLPSRGHASAMRRISVHASLAVAWSRPLLFALSHQIERLLGNENFQELLESPALCLCGETRLFWWFVNVWSRADKCEQSESECTIRSDLCARSTELDVTIAGSISCWR